MCHRQLVEFEYFLSSDEASGCNYNLISCLATWTPNSFITLRRCKNFLQFWKVYINFHQITYETFFCFVTRLNQNENGNIRNLRVTLFPLTIAPIGILVIELNTINVEMYSINVEKVRHNSSTERCWAQWMHDTVAEGRARETGTEGGR